MITLVVVFEMLYKVHRDYRQIVKASMTNLKQVRCVSDVGTGSPYVSQIASFSPVLVKYRHTRLLVRPDLVLLVATSEACTLLVELLVLLVLVAMK